MKCRVVITGMGAVTPIGNTVPELWAAAREGRCGIGPITAFDPAPQKVRLAAEVKGLDIAAHIPRAEARKMARFTQLGVIAAQEAFDQSGITPENTDYDRCGVLVSSGIGGLSTIQEEHDRGRERGWDRVSPFFIPMSITNMAAGTIAIRLGLKGMCSCVVTACAGGTNAIGDAFHYIRDGYAEAMVCGGAEAAITPLAVGGFTSMKALCEAEDPARASIPFDRERSGFVMGEGAARCMRAALADAGLMPEEIGYINAHGTSTPMNDRCETAAIRAVFGEHCPPTSSTKSMTGHLLGAAGGVEAILTALALSQGFLPPTIGYREPDPECDLDVVPNAGRKAAVGAALSNSLGFGGHNATLALKRFRD